MAGTAFTGWRVGTANAVLLACYLVPAWAWAVWKIWIAPMRGLFDVANLGPAIFATNVLHLAPSGLMRFAMLVALVKFTVVIFFMAFVVFSLSSREDEREEGLDLLHVGLALASAVSFTSTVLAWHFGEVEALRLHATETLMILSAVIVVILDVPRAAAPAIPVSASARIAPEPRKAA